MAQKQVEQVEYVDLSERYNSSSQKDEKKREKKDFDENIIATQACIESIKDLMNNLSIRFRD